jgi:CheY-like chemotaxis protein
MMQGVECGIVVADDAARARLGAMLRDLGAEHVVALGSVDPRALAGGFARATRMLVFVEQAQASAWIDTIAEQRWSERAPSEFAWVELLEPSEVPGAGGGGHRLGALAFPASSEVLASALREVYTGPTPNAEGAAEAPLAGLRVLVAEDEPINQVVVAELLKMAGARAQVVSNGREACEALLAHGGDFDVVLMDVQMPEMDGHEAARRIRGDPRHASLPIIAMTAHALADERERALASGMDDYLGKPFHAAELRAMLLRWRTRASGAARPPAPSTRLPRVLRDLPGADAAAGVARLGGDATAYLRLLDVFVARIPADLESLAQAVARRDPGMLLELAHTIKGAASSLALTSIAHAATQTEAAARAGRIQLDEVRWLMEQLRALHRDWPADAR